MPVPSTPHDSHAIIAAVLIISALCVVYWRMTFRLLVILVIALAVYGAIVGLHI